MSSVILAVNAFINALIIGGELTSHFQLQMEFSTETMA
jgi:hypothetical protein